MAAGRMVVTRHPGKEAEERRKEVRGWPVLQLVSVDFTFTSVHAPICRQTKDTGAGGHSCGTAGGRVDGEGRRWSRGGVVQILAFYAAAVKKASLPPEPLLLVLLRHHRSMLAFFLLSLAARGRCNLGCARRPARRAGRPVGCERCTTTVHKTILMGRWWWFCRF